MIYYIKYNLSDGLIVDKSLTNDLNEEPGVTEVTTTSDSMVYYASDAYKYSGATFILIPPESPNPQPPKIYYFLVNDTSGEIEDKSENDDLTVGANQIAVNSNNYAPYVSQHAWYWDINQSKFVQKSFKRYKIYDYIDDREGSQYTETEVPKSLDYVIGLKQKLYPKRTFTDGSLVEVVWYENHDLQNDIYDTPVIKVEIQYFFNSDDYVTHRIVTRKWAYDDGTYPNDSSEWKVTEKHYTFKEALEEGIIRRTNIVNILKGDVVGLIMQTESTDTITAEGLGIAFFIENKDAIESYIQVNYRDVINSNIDNASLTQHYWLDNDIGGGTTIADYIKSKLNYSTS